MNVIKFNNSEFEVESYTKNTYFTQEGIISNANCSLNTNNIEAVNALAEGAITSIVIEHDHLVIYSLTDVNAKIDNINEYLNGNRMNISLTLTFTNDTIADA